MGVYTFQCHRCDGIWRGKQYHGDLEASAESTYDLQRKLVKQVKLTHDAYSGEVQSSFSLISPSAAVFQVIVCGSNMEPETKSSSSDIKQIAPAESSKINSCLKLFENLWLNESKHKNFAFSPFSIFTVLGILAYGASGETLKQILEFLHYESLDDLNSVSIRLVDELVQTGNDGEGPKLSFVNGLWFSNTSTLNPEFKETVCASNKAEVESVDFTEEEVARSKVNKWVERKTNGLIQEILPHGIIRQNTRVVAANALYFKGSWEHDQFDASQTKERTFYLLDGRSIQVPSMFTWEEYLYVSCHDDFKVLKLPYNLTSSAGKKVVGKSIQSSTQRFSMCIVLPNRLDGLGRLIQKVSSDSAGFLDRYLPTSQVEVNNFMLPKFKILFDFDAIRVLRQSGLVLPFDSDKAELRNMLMGENVCIEHVFHKCFVEVDEEGTEAGAATAAIGGEVSMFEDDPPPRGVDFVADHPFMFIIREERSGVVLFMGHVLNPLLDS